MLNIPKISVPQIKKAISFGCDKCFVPDDLPQGVKPEDLPYNRQFHQFGEDVPAYVKASLAIQEPADTPKLPPQPATDQFVTAWQMPHTNDAEEAQKAALEGLYY